MSRSEAIPQLGMLQMCMYMTGSRLWPQTGLCMPCGLRQLTRVYRQKPDKSLYSLTLLHAPGVCSASTQALECAAGGSGEISWR